MKVVSDMETGRQLHIRTADRLCRRKDKKTMCGGGRKIFLSLQVQPIIVHSGNVKKNRINYSAFLYNNIGNLGVLWRRNPDFFNFFGGYSLKTGQFVPGV